MKKIYIFLITTLFSISGFSQITFEHTFDYSSDDEAISALEISGGGYIVCGNVKDDANGDFDIFVSKFDADGKEIWSEIYTSIGVDDDFAEYLIETSDGNYLICGSTSDEASGDTDGFLLKITTSGVEIFNETYGVEGDDDIFYYITEITGGGLAVAGASTEGEEGFTDGWLALIDDDGTFIDEFFYGLNGNDEITTVIETDDEGLIMVGNSYDAVNGDVDGMLIKVDAELAQEWIVFENTTADQFFNDLIILENGDYLVVGALEDVVNGDMDMSLTRISSDGNTSVYSYVFDYMSGDDMAVNAYVDANDDIFISGFVEDTDNGDIDAYLAIIDADNGDILGDEIYGDIYDDYFNNFSFTADNGFICVGKQEDVNGEFDVYMVKTDENGDINTSVEKIENFSATITPNLATDIIEIKTSTTEELNYTLIDMSGKIIEKSILKSNQIDVSNLESNMYLLQLESAAFKNTFKFVKK